MHCFPLFLWLFYSFSQANVHTLSWSKGMALQLFDDRANLNNDEYMNVCLFYVHIAQLDALLPKRHLPLQFLKKDCWKIIQSLPGDYLQRFLAQWHFTGFRSLFIGCQILTKRPLAGFASFVHSGLVSLLQWPGLTIATGLKSPTLKDENRQICMLNSIILKNKKF